MTTFDSVTMFTNLASFNGTNGYKPIARLIQAKDGNFYGTTSYGGVYNSGTVFQFTTNNVLNSLVSLNGTNGSQPASGVIQGIDGNFYGTAAVGGPYTNLDTFFGGHIGFGTIFQLTTNGVLNVLAAFSGTNGSVPNGLIQTSDGTFYGTSQYGTPNQNPLAFNNGNGCIFELDTNYNLTNPYFFSSANGSYPIAPLVQGINGNFYGSTIAGGSANVGTLFQCTSNNLFTSLDSFDGTNNGITPNGLILGRDGNFYGTTVGSSLQYGTAFQMKPDGTLKTLATFDATNGFMPTFLMQANDGNFYGTTSQGGAYNKGTFFQLSTNGTLSAIYSFTGGSDGNDATSVLQAADGNFYGTTSYGGDFGKGSIFKISLVPMPNIQTVTAANGVINLTWSAAPGRQYQVQYITNLTPTGWNTLTNVTASGAIGTATDSTGQDAQRFYRIVLVL